MAEMKKQVNVKDPQREKVWLSSPHMGENELRYVQEAFATNWIAPLGPHLESFERELGNYAGVAHVAALSSGTAALHLALQLLGVGRGDEVLVQSLTFVASANPVIYQGAVPVFIDSEAESWNLSPQYLEEAIVDGIRRGKKPKAVVTVHLYGMPYQVEEVHSICRKYEVAIIEDAAEALGGSYRGGKLGSFGDFAVFSFNGNKIITTSGGGALLSNNEEQIKQARFLSTQARDAAVHYQHSVVGYNYRLSNVLAGIGRGQLEVLDQRVAKRRENFEYYRQRLSQIPGISFQPEPEGCFSNRWLTTFVLNLESNNRCSPEEICRGLAEYNIECRPLWKPLHLQPVFAGCRYFGGNCSEELFTRGVCLPSGSNLKSEDLELTCSVLEKLLQR